MTRYHATVAGNVPFTAAEEAEWDIQEAEYTASANDRAAAEVRKERDTKLAETDWTGMSDVTMSTEMATYRQALRDITTHADFPNLSDDDWPVEPE